MGEGGVSDLLLLLLFDSYSEELSLIYMAARLDGGFAAVFRAFHEVRVSQHPTEPPLPLVLFSVN